MCAPMQSPAGVTPQLVHRCGCTAARIVSAVVGAKKITLSPSPFRSAHPSSCFRPPSSHRLWGLLPGRGVQTAFPPAVLDRDGSFSTTSGRTQQTRFASSCALIFPCPNARYRAHRRGDCDAGGLLCPADHGMAAIMAAIMVELDTVVAIPGIATPRTPRSRELPLPTTWGTAVRRPAILARVRATHA